MTTTTETRALIARVRATIAPADQPQALRDLARTADGEPPVDAGMLLSVADEIEDARRRVVPPSLVDVWLAFDADDRVGSIVEDPSLCDFIAGEIESYRDLADEHEQEIEQLRARVAELEEKLAELEAETLSAATVIAQANSEAEEIHDRLSDVLGEAFGPHAPMSAAEIVDALEREIYQRREDLPMAYERGQEAMRERAARACFALAYGADWPSELEQAVCNAYMNAGTVVRALPLDDGEREDAREDAQGGE